MKHVYIVTEGSYSDYHIVAAFSSREKAEEFIEVFPDNYRRIELHDLDTNVASMARQGATQWYVSMHRDGSVDKVKDTARTWYDALYVDLEIIKDRLIGIVFAHSQEHAIKIANDHRAMLISTGQWPQERGKI